MGRSKTTNKPDHLAALTPLRQARRRRDLVAMFIEALGGRDTISDLALVAVKRAAELTCASERARAIILTSDSVLAADLEMLSRLRGCGGSCRACALGIKADKHVAKPHPSPSWSGPLRARINAPVTPPAKTENAP